MGLLDRITAKAVPYEDDIDDENVDYEDYDVDDYDEDDAEVSTIHPVSSSSEVARIVTVWVSSYNDVKDFATEFRDGLPVVLNLSEANDAERKRIVDFAVGICFGLEGDFNRISDDVFLLTPKSVKIETHSSDSTRHFV